VLRITMTAMLEQQSRTRHRTRRTSLSSYVHRYLGYNEHTTTGAAML